MSRWLRVFRSGTGSQWITLGLSLAVAGSIVGFHIYRDYHRTFSRQQERLLIQARVVQENLGKNLHSVNKVLGSLRDDWSPRLPDAGQNRRLKDLADAMPGVRTIFAMDAQGTIIAANRDELVGKNLKGREYFTIPKSSNNPATLYVSPPFKTVLGSFLINVSRTISTPDGAFASIVTAALDPEYFKTLLTSVLYAPDMWTFIAHGDGLLFMMLPEQKGVVGKNLAVPGTFFSRHRESGLDATVQSGVVHATGDERLLVWRTVQPAGINMDKPLHVAASRRLEQVFETWRRESLIQGVVFCLVASLASAWLFSHQSRRRELDLQEARAAAALKESAERLQLATSAAGVGVWEYNPDSGDMIWDDSMYAIYGINPAGPHPAYEVWSNAVLPVDLPVAEAALQAALAGGQSFNITFRIRRGDGQIRSIRAMAEVFRSPDSSLCRIVGINEDITERTRLIEQLIHSEQALREKTDELERFFSLTLDLLCITDTDGRFIRANRSWETTLGYSVKDLERRSFLDLIHPDDLQATLSSLQDLAADKPVLDFTNRYRCKDGTYRWLEWRSHPYENKMVYAAARDVTDRLLAADALRESRQQLRDIFDFLPDATLVVNNEGRVIAWNRAIEEMTGVSKAEMLGRGEYACTVPFYGQPRPHLLDLLDVNDEELAARYANVVRKGETLYAEAFTPALYGGRGAYVWATGAPLYDTEGRRIGAIESIRDINSQKKTQQDLLESRQQLMDIIDFLPDATLVIDSDGVVRAWNRSMEMLTGVPAAEVLGKGDYAYSLPFYGRRRPILIDLALHTHPEQEKDYTALRREGDLIFGESYSPSLPGGRAFLSATASVLRDAEGRITGAIQCIRDNTERKATEENLDRFRLLVENSEDAIYSKTLDGHISSWNAAAERIYGYRADEIIGRHVSILLDPDFPNELPMLMEQLERGEKVEHYETVRVHKDGRRLTMSMTQSAMRDDQGHLLEVSVIARDITQQKLAEVQLEQLNRDLQVRTVQAEAANRAKSSFLANISHEIRTPMNAIIGMSYLALQTELDARQHDYLKKIHLSAESLLEIINDILDFSKIEAGKLEIEQAPFRLTEVIRNMEGLFRPRAEEKGIQLLFRIPHDLPAILVGDRFRLGQILANLIGNAVKFTENGHVLVEVKAEKAASPERISLNFSVSDTGIGLDKAQIERIFAPFTQADSSITRRYGGTGLGLSIVKQLVELMGGGGLEVSSEPGSGSRFAFHLECGIGAAGALATAEAAPSPEGAQLQGVRVLLVEDNPINQQVAHEILTRAGIVVCQAANGYEALEQVASQRFDAVLMDIQMPEMDGYETTRLIRRRFMDLPIIAMTAHALQEEREQCLASGMNDHIPKPVQAQKLLRCLEKWIRAGRAGEQDTQQDAPPATAADEFAGPSNFNTPAALARLGGNRSLYRKLLSDFSDQNRDLLQRLRLALETEDWSQILAEVHTFKSTAGSLGAEGLAGAAEQLEQAVRQGERDTVPELLVGLEQRLHQALATIQATATGEAAGGGGEDAIAGPELAPLLTELGVLLESNNLEAVAFLEQVRGVRSAEMELLRKQVTGLDFRKALATLEHILGSLPGKKDNQQLP